jgi:hypothetical protein
MSVTDLSSLLASLRQEAESKITSEISGPLNMGKRFLYDAVMPIHLNISSESQDCNLKFLPGGRVELHQGLASDPDISLKGDLSTLTDIIIQRSSSLFEKVEQEGKIVVVSQSWKGEQAMQKVRELLSANP